MSRSFLVLLALLIVAPNIVALAERDLNLKRYVPTGEQLRKAYQRRTQSSQSGNVYKAQIRPHWFANDKRFWYRNQLDDNRREFVLVDAESGTRKPAFDHDRLAKMLRGAGVGDAQADRLPISELDFDLEADLLKFHAAGKRWSCDLKTYALTRLRVELAHVGDGTNSLKLSDVPSASSRTGPETELTFVNQTEGEVELFWLNTNGRRRSYGKVSAHGRLAQHTYAGHVWLVVDSAGDTIVAFRANGQPGRAIVTGDKRDVPGNRNRRSRDSSREGSGADNTSPDGRSQAYVEDDNIYVRPTGFNDASEAARKAVRLTSDGEPDNAYGRIGWAPDSQRLVAFRIKPGDRHEVHFVESSPQGGGRAKLHSRPYALPGDAMTSYELHLFRSDGWQQTKPNVEPVDFRRPRARWNDDGRHLAYEKVDRGHQRFRVIEVDVKTGEPRTIIDEQTDTFIWTAHTERIGVRPVTWLEETNEIIYASEVDGWRHLYLIDPAIAPDDESNAYRPQVESGGRKLLAPGLKNQITKGNFVVRGIDRIDEQQRQIWFRASGRNSDQDPYFIHYYRVNFDGTGLVALTVGNGNHSVQFSPGRQYIIDTYSRVDLPPVHKLRRTNDGSLVCKLEEADISELAESGWESPEVFVAKGRDGTTDIWGVIHRPRDFDPNKKYPVIEAIYAGPHGSHVPKSFSARSSYESLNAAGFIVVKIDGMGTANRSKDFHDVCWHNLEDAGFPDRILWMKAATAKYPQMDLSRVGIYGGSAGGQNAGAAVLFHPEFYKVAVAGCGCHDNRMDKASWNEQWMGYPVGPQYSKSSNIDNAHRLQGNLLLIVGEMDTNVPPESTLRFADALINAGKDFDLLVVPGGGHGMGGSYGQRRLMDFFVEHLHGVKPPNRNATQAK